ncbi:peptidoglycan editing factor PgeF [Oceanobacillus halophilus]|uniref:Purine nucleoside phosphorylase n=1 Tax=Oceanobacillus halophilus TaxID=930130 RepID=A0A495ABM8_9BACI|nr:peptidoglycan editing factor PgeF [Oceanobacillus halophilus]RKQ37406.1 peptidoglycan editing factor PgeF [Oceanobacillus halophilus]
MNEPFRQSDISYLHIEKWQQLNAKLIAGFTTRNGGISNPPFHSYNFGFHVRDNQRHVIQNRHTLAGKIQLPLKQWVSGEQVHQTNIKLIDHNDIGKGSLSYDSSLKGIDGLITNEKGVLCTAFFADCVPLYFFDPVTEYIGIAHAGWKGTVNYMAEKMVHALTEKGVNKKDLLVTIGPCISREMYEVDENVIMNIDSKYLEKTVVPKENNHFLLDLKQLNVEILLQNGILRHNIEVTNYCTYKDNALFFSHRRDNGKTGRMLGFLGYLA